MALHGEDTLKIGIEAAQYHYHETLYQHRFMSLSGPLLGINLEYVHNEDPFLIGAEGRALFGNSKYKGSKFNLTTRETSKHVTNGTQNEIFEAKVIAGPRLDVFDFYIGVGARIKKDENEKDLSHYPRESTYLYLPVGAKVNLFEAEDELISKITPKLEYNHLLRGEQKSFLDDYLGGKIRKKQTRGHGLKGSVAFQINSIEVAPYVNYWNIKRSVHECKSCYYGTICWIEPDNKTVEAGVSIKYVF